MWSGIAIGGAKDAEAGAGGGINAGKLDGGKEKSDGSGREASMGEADVMVFFFIGGRRAEEES